MEEAYLHLCMGCMEDKGDAQVCPHCGYNEENAEKFPAYLPPRTILRDRYIVGKVLAQGGFGITYIGFDTVLRKRRAIKEYFHSTIVVREGNTANVTPSRGNRELFQEGLRLFLEEARNVAQFDKHQHIVNVYDFFQERGTGYMVMGFLEGETLTHFLEKRGGKVSLEDAKGIMFPILDALKALHAKQLYHRDISPKNIMMIPGQGPVLIDFGAARYIIGELSQSINVILTPGYAPLEQYSSAGAQGPWTDIYACGATLYFMLSGIIPPSATARVFRDDLLPPTMVEELKLQRISDKMDEVLLRALAVRHEDRFQSVEEFEKALQEAVSDEGEHKEDDDPPNSNSVAQIILTLVILGLLLGMGYLSMPYVKKRLERKPTPTPTAAPIPTAISAPTAPPAPTTTPLPTATPVPPPTATSVVEATPTPIEAIRIEKVTLIDENGLIIHPFNNRYRLNPGENASVKVEISPPGVSAKLQLASIFGKVLNNGRYQAPQMRGKTDLLTVKVKINESGSTIQTVLKIKVKQSN